ncbi:MAG: hypothetical protein PHG43_01960, partial [Phenylobacterium sp.]|nr:hypothetical protein [Phenylobacterium sp.]
MFPPIAYFRSWGALPEWTSILTLLGVIRRVHIKNSLTFNANVTTSAPKGRVGTLLLDPTNIYIATDQASATSAGMVTTDTSAGTGAPNFTAVGAVQDSLLTVTDLQLALVANAVSVTTANASGTGIGNIKVVNPVNWDGSTYSLTLTAANNIVVDASLQTAAVGGGDITLTAGNQITLNAPLISTSNATPNGKVTLTAGNGGIASGASGTVTALNLGISSSGNVSLPNGNTFSTVAGTITGDLNLNNTLGYSIGSVNAIDGITASGTVTLHAVDAVTQTKPISAIGLELTGTGAGSYTLTGANSVGILAANVQSGFSFTNAGALEIGTVGSNSGVTAGSVTLNAGGALTTAAAATVKSDNITIQSTAAGQVGTEASLFATEAATTSTAFTIGNAAFLGGYFDHTDAAALSTVSLAAN